MSSASFYKNWLKWVSISLHFISDWRAFPWIENIFLALAVGLRVRCVLLMHILGLARRKLNSASSFQYRNSLSYGQFSLHSNEVLKYSTGMTEILDETIIMQTILTFYFLSKGLMTRMAKSSKSFLRSVKLLVLQILRILLAKTELWLCRDSSFIRLFLITNKRNPGFSLFLIDEIF